LSVIGVLALQGDFREHANVLRTTGCEAKEIRLPEQLDSIDGLIIPGGESTTIVQLMDSFGFINRVKQLARGGMPIWGTCAGMIVLAGKLMGDRPEPLGLIDIEVERNAFGRQIDSFETMISVPVLGSEPFKGVFIRAPIITLIGSGVEIIATIDNQQVVAAKQNNILVTSFHPELTDDPRFHEYFSTMISGVGN
tara:strand:- start:5447 stop:6031 length:585 start_codon:yes stop_codon:yes gene_type:complete